MDSLLQATVDRLCQDLNEALDRIATLEFRQRQFESKQDEHTRIATVLTRETEHIEERLHRLEQQG